MLYFTLKWEDIKGQNSANTFPVTDVCSSPPLTFLFVLHAGEFKCESRIGLRSQRRRKKNTQKLRGAGAQNVVDLLKQHVRFTVCVWFLSDSTTLLLTWPDGIISSLALSVTKQLLHYKKLGELCRGVLYESSGIRPEFLVLQSELLFFNVLTNYFQSGMLNCQNMGM